MTPFKFHSSHPLVQKSLQAMHLMQIITTSGAELGAEAVIYSNLRGSVGARIIEAVIGLGHQVLILEDVPGRG